MGGVKNYGSEKVADDKILTIRSFYFVRVIAHFFKNKKVAYDDFQFPTFNEQIVSRGLQM